MRTFCPVEWRGIEALCPIWERSLEEIFDQDENLIAFVQKLFGYAITGSVEEQILPILWGEGANGKSTIMDMIGQVLGTDYCHGTQTDVLIDSHYRYGESARPFLMAFRGKRIIFAAESKENQTLDAGLIKKLTGDQTTTARGMYKNPMTFLNTAKIILVTNHPPKIRDGDDFALWRRIVRIPFTQRFVENPQTPNEHRVDKDLLMKLRVESSGILAWLVRGCIAWQEQGLNPPKIVTDSTETYREDEDLISQFVKERLFVGPAYNSAAGALYKDYKQWCDNHGYSPLSGKTFGSRMARRFGPSEHKHKGQIYFGVGLKTE